MPYQQLRFCSRLLSLFVIGLLMTSAPATIAANNDPTQTVRLRFVDSATGHAVKPTTVEATPPEGKPTRRVRRNGVTAEGRTTLDLQAGVHTIHVTAPGYQPMTGEFTVQPDNPYQLVFQLDPIAPPQEIEPTTIATLHRVNETVFLGFVVAEDSGQPVANAVVKTEPSGRETRTDARGYFQIYVPVQTREEATNAPAKISFAHPGFRTEERRYLELWSEGDWIYRIRLDRGDGIKTVDERTLRRRSEYPVATKEEIPPLADPEKTALASESNTPVIPTPNQGEILSQESTVIGMAQTMSTPVPVRIPTNIRVLRQDGVTIDYISLQTYCQRSLPSEWIASWGSVGPGNSGTNSLLSGAVAIRTYAIGFINNPANAAYDICGTTACQAYNPTASDSRTTAAVNFTANYVMIQPGRHAHSIQDHGVFRREQLAGVFLRRWLHPADGGLPLGSGLHRRSSFRTRPRLVSMGYGALGHGTPHAKSPDQRFRHERLPNSELGLVARTLLSQFAARRRRAPGPK
jgi:hypothetical protein